jgi:hypothetical protein
MPGFLLISMVYYVFMDRTSLSPAVQHAGCAMLAAGIVAQSAFLSQYEQGAAKPRFYRHHRDRDRRHTAHVRHCRIGVWAVYRALKGSR